MFEIRIATPADRETIQQLIAISARDLSREYYSEEQVSAALKSVYGVDSMLIEDATYFVAEADDIIIGCGGWSKRKTLYGGDQWTDREAAILDPEHDAAKIRAFFVHPAWTRRGIGSMILEASERAAVAAGFTHFEMGATLTGVPLYRAHGYIPMENLQVLLGNGEVLPIVRMEKRVPFDSRLR